MWDYVKLICLFLGDGWVFVVVSIGKGVKVKMIGDKIYVFFVNNIKY